MTNHMDKRRANKAPKVFAGWRHAGARPSVPKRFVIPSQARLPSVKSGVHILAGILVAIFVAACDREPRVPQIPVSEWRAWTLPPDGATLPTPRSVAAGLNDEIAVLDTAGRVLIFTADGALLRQWKMLDVSVGKPEGLVVLKDGRIVVCDTHYHRIVYFDPEGRILKTFGKHGTAPGEFIYPVAITTDAQENLYVCEYGGHDRVQKFTREGAYLLEFGSFGTAPGEFQRPAGIVWNAGRIYVTDAVNNRVLVFTDEGKFKNLLGSGKKPLAFDLPYDITLGGDGALYVIEYGAGQLSKVGTDGRLLAQYGSTGSGEAEFGTPWGLCIDAKNRLFIADTKNRRLVRLSL